MAGATGASGAAGALFSHTPCTPPRIDLEIIKLKVVQCALQRHSKCTYAKHTKITNLSWNIPNKKDNFKNLILYFVDIVKMALTRNKMAEDEKQNSRILAYSPILRVIAMGVYL